jgi:hypothetical protein
MKRNTKPFSVEIKKSRVQGQRHPLPPRRLIEPMPVAATKFFQREEPQAAAEPSPGPRILPSIIQPVWSSSEPAAPVRRKRASGEVNREQMELDLTASTSEGVKETHSAVPVITRVVPQADSAAEEDAKPIYYVQPVQGENANANSRRPRKKASGVVEQIEAFQAVIDLDQIPEPEMIGSSAVTPSRAGERRLTKRQVTAAQLPRHERWKRRLHPASW